MLNVNNILLLVLILLVIGAWPSWPHSRKWGYGPSGAAGLVAAILIVLLIF